MTAAIKHTPRHPLLILEYKDAGVQELEHKDTSAQPGAGNVVVDIDESKGLVTAIVSVTGIEDQVKDVIHPGSYAETLANRRPKVVQHHDWKQPVARVDEVVELAPGDARLPGQTSDGKPWPPDAGALLATMQYNLKTAAGRDAFETVKFYSKTGECQWSIGYKVPKGKSTRSKDGVRQIKAIDLYEISFVLFGAAPLTGTLAIKSGDGAADQEPEQNPADTDADAAPADTGPAEAGPAEGEPDVRVLHADAADAIDWDQVDLASHLPAPAEEDGEADTGTGDGDGESEGDGEAEGDSEAEAQEAQQQDGAPAAEHAGDGAAEAADAEGEGQGAANGEGEHPGGQDAAPGGADGGDGEGDSDAKRLDAQPWFDAGVKRLFSPQKRRTLAKEGTALPDGSYPIATVPDLRNAIKAFGRAKPADRARVKRHIVKRARALGKPDLIPQGWGGGKGESAQETKAGAPGVADTPGEGMAVERLKHWYTKGEGAARIRWGQPGDFMRCVGIAEKHMRPDQAKGFCQLRHKDALGVYAGQEGGPDRKDLDTAELAKAYDPGIEVGPDAGSASPPDVVESALYPHLPGTFEETRDLLHRALASRVFGATGAKSALVTVDGTWDDQVVATYFPDDGDPVSYEIGYDIDTDGKVWLSEPEEVKLTASVGEGDGGEVLPHPAMLDQITERLRATLLHESKAGRVLSAVNANRLRGAVEQLVAVLEAAGMPIGETEEIEPDSEPVTAPDSTAPSARPEAVYDPGMKALIDPALHARALRIFSAANGD